MFTENYCVRRFTRYLGSRYEQDGHSHGLHDIGEKTNLKNTYMPPFNRFFTPLTSHENLTVNFLRTQFSVMRHWLSPAKAIRHRTIYLY